VDEDVLIIDERLGCRPLTTGLLLLAIPERGGEHTTEIIPRVALSAGASIGVPRGDTSWRCAPERLCFPGADMRRNARS
jgi:hypothetical protein